MARARNIKPGFYKNEDLAECSVWARLIFPGLWMLADREGRLEDRPKKIKGELLPFDSQEIEPLLRELAQWKFILRYEVDGVGYIQILKFKEHQTPHYSEKASVFPPPNSEKCVRMKTGVLQESLRHDALDESRNDASMKDATILDGSGRSPENSWKDGPIKGGSQPPDSLIPDSLIPESLHNTSCPEPSAKPRARSRPAVLQYPGEAVVKIPVVGYAEPEIDIPKGFADEMQAAYPRVDVEATLGEIRAWCIANPANRKTIGGVTRFINSWLSREQNRG